MFDGAKKFYYAASCDCPKSYRHSVGRVGEFQIFDFYDCFAKASYTCKYCGHTTYVFRMTEEKVRRVLNDKVNFRRKSESRYEETISKSWEKYKDKKKKTPKKKRKPGPKAKADIPKYPAEMRIKEIVDVVKREKARPKILWDEMLQVWGW